jgi:hypothetical protein
MSLLQAGKAVSGTDLPSRTLVNRLSIGTTTKAHVLRSSRKQEQHRTQFKLLVRKRLAALKVKQGDFRKLIELCRDSKSSEEDRCEASELLGLLHLITPFRHSRRREISRVLIENIREDKARLAWCSAVSIGYLGEVIALRPLLKIARAKGLLRTETRRAAIYALGWLNQPDATPLLIRILEDRKEPTKLRAEAAEALASCGCDSKRAMMALLHSLWSRFADLRFSSAYALGQCATIRREREKSLRAKPAHRD